MQKTKRFGKDFILVIIGQIISLFGNAVLRFALPPYLFDQTGSPTLLGLVSAGSFLPMVVLSPVGGIVADRVNKRNIMVVLDFSAAALIALFALALGRMPLVPLLMAVLLLLYGIQALIRDHLVHQSLYPGKQPLVAHCLQNVLLRLEMVINGSFGQISKRIDDVLDGGVFISLFQKQLQRHI